MFYFVEYNIEFRNWVSSMRILFLFLHNDGVSSETPVLQYLSLTLFLSVLIKRLNHEGKRLDYSGGWGVTSCTVPLFSLLV